MSNETTILVVDDSLVNLAVLDEILDRQKFKVLMANSGEKALAVAKDARPKPNLILLDVVMPGWDGYETCQRFKADPELTAIPILFLSGLGETENKVRALKAGGVDYVSKPFQEEELLARVGTHVELARLREGLEREVEAKTAEIQSLLEALQISYQKAQEASVLKTQFLRNISHEFRTPMNIILGTIDEMIEDTELDNEQQQMAETVSNAGKQLMEILTNMLSFSQQFEGEMEQELVVFDLPALLNDVTERYMENAVAKSLVLKSNIMSKMPIRVHGNRNYLYEILCKLVDNAIKYTQRGGIYINVMPETIGEGEILCRFEVKDTGIGVPYEKREHLFETFSQIDGSSTRIYGGMGMGLALAKLYAETIGGKIGLESLPDEGALFWFTAPLDFSAV
jgi:signal transduction histidine kinase